MEFFTEDKRVGLPLKVTYGTNAKNAKAYEIEVAFIDSDEIDKKVQIAREIIKYDSYISTNEDILKDETLAKEIKDELTAEVKKFEIAKARLTRESRLLNLKEDGSEKSEDELKHEQKEFLHSRLEQIVVGGVDRVAFLQVVKSTLKVDRYVEFINMILSEANEAKEGKSIE